MQLKRLCTVPSGFPSLTQLLWDWTLWYRHMYVCMFSPDRSASGSSGESSPRRGSSPFSSPILAGPSMVCGPGSPTRRLSMGDSRPAGSPLSGGGHQCPVLEFLQDRFATGLSPSTLQFMWLLLLLTMLLWASSLGEEPASKTFPQGYPEAEASCTP